MVLQAYQYLDKLLEELYDVLLILVEHPGALLCIVLTVCQLTEQILQSLRVVRNAQQLLGCGHLACDMDSDCLQIGIDGTIVQLLQAGQHYTQCLAGQIETQIRIATQCIDYLIDIRGFHFQQATPIAAATTSAQA